MLSLLSDSPSPAVQAESLPFEQRACFVAGPSKSGTTLLVSLLDGHPDLLAFPEETAYFPTVRTKYRGRSRREQFDYLTRQSLAGVIFGAAGRRGQHAYADFPADELLARFERAAFAPANAGRDLLVILLETYAAVLGRPQGSVRRWVEKTPANRDHLPAIFERFPHARVLLTLRDPRALLSAQIQLERTRRRRHFSVYLMIKHWRTAARLALQQQESRRADDRVLVVGFQRLLQQPEHWMRKVCAFLDVPFDGAMLRPTKVGLPWAGNSASEQTFDAISTEPVNRWRKLLSEEEIGWVEWHCRDLMEPLGYQPTLARSRLRHWTKPVRGETPKEYLKSRLCSLRHWKRS